MRIGGLASGMDTDQIIKDLMKANRIPLDKMKQKKQVLEWQRDDYRSMNMLLFNFRSDLTQMKLSSNYRARAVTSTDESKITVSASSGASKASYTISNVTSLASSETILNNGDTGLDKTKGLYDQTKDFADPIAWRDGAIASKTVNVTADGNTIDLGNINPLSGNAEDWNIKVNGKTYKVGEGVTVDTTDANNIKLVFTDNIAQGATVKVDYIAKTRTDTLAINKDITSLQLAQGSINNFSITLKNEDGSTPLTIEGNVIKNGATKIGTLDKATGKITLEKDAITFQEGKNYSLEVTYDHKLTNFTMNTETTKGKISENFFVTGNDTLNSVISKVNNSSLGVSMFFDDTSKKMTLTRTETGNLNNSNSQITYSGDLINKAFKFDGATATKGTNAIFTVNGLEIQRTSNSFDMNGVSITLKQKFTDPVSVNVNNDGSKVYDNIKTFVDKYNDLIGKINGKIKEERYRSYTPLTDDQREQLSDKQQEMWEEKAKSGLLRRDSMLSSVLTEMRMDFSQPVMNDNVNNVYKQLAEIGITTTANYLEGGKLEINEAKLKKAIEENPEAVENLFIGQGTTESEKGIIHRLSDTATKSMDKIRTKAGNANTTNDQFMIGKELKTLSKRINDFDERMKMLETRYYRQFSAMEKAVQKANSQSAYLMNAFGGGK